MGKESPLLAQYDPAVQGIHWVMLDAPVEFRYVPGGQLAGSVTPAAQ